MPTVAEVVRRLDRLLGGIEAGACLPERAREQRATLNAILRSLRFLEQTGRRDQLALRCRVRRADEREALERMRAQATAAVGAAQAEWRATERAADAPESVAS